jgi:hypothetical protein
MIESGFYSWAVSNSALQPLLGRSANDKTQKIFSAFYFSFLPKNSARPAIVLDRLKSPDAADTLDARTPAPGTLIDARFQFGSVAEDSNENPVNASGYLSAALLSQALRRQLAGLATGNADLPDGTLIKDVYDWDEFDAHYELGGDSYIYRRIQQVTVLFQETS